MKKSKAFHSALLNWYNPAERPLPWKGIKNPYKIWVSEIILQQTRAEQAIPYYHNFIAAFPNVEALAKAPLDKVLKTWEGLGYYSRARNMHAAASDITSKHKGKLPASYSQLLNLKGIGPYTAAAIASFAFDLPHAVLDGNVYRVLSRYFNIASPINESKSKKEFLNYLNKVFAPKKAALFNQAIMDFGATVCTPKKPFCSTCPFSNDCLALKLGQVNELPKKTKKHVKKDRYFHYLLVQNKEELLIQKRTGKDIWQGLFQLPLIETSLDAHTDYLEASFQKQFKTKTLIKLSKLEERTSVLSHQNIRTVFWQAELDRKPKHSLREALWIKKNDLSTFAFPKMFDLFFKQFSLI